jgi:hypothetical protein
MRSASEGPPRRAARAEALREVVGWAAVEVGSEREAEEFSMDHFRRLLRFGSSILGRLCWLRRWIWEEWEIDDGERFEIKLIVTRLYTSA